MENSLFPIAERMIVEGLAVFPCYKNKRPRTKRGFYDSTTDIEQAKLYFLNHIIGTGYIGIRTGAAAGGIVVIDIDVGKDGDIRSASEIIEYIRDTHGPLPDTLTVNTPSGGRHLYYKAAQPLKTASRFIPGDPVGIDCRAESGYVIGPDEENYFTDGNFTIKNCVQIPEWIVKILLTEKKILNSNNFTYTGQIPLIPEMKKEISAALDHLDYNDRDVWIAQGFSLKSLDSEDARRLWDEWSQKSEKFDAIDQDKKWNSFEPKNITIGSLFYDARKAGYSSEIKIQTENFNVSDQRFKLYDIHDIFRDRPPREWLIDKLFIKNGLYIIAGDAGSGKTYAAIDIAACIAIGIPWLDMNTVKGNVLIIDEESGDYRLATRFKQVIKSHGGNKNTVSAYYTTMQSVNLRAPVDMIEIEKIIIEKNIKFVVIDALMDVTPGINENSTEEMVPALNALNKIKERTGVSFLVIHHKLKAWKENVKTRFRGTTGIIGVADLMLEIHRESKSDIIEFEITKHRDGMAFDFYAELIISDFDFRLERTDKKENVKLKRQFTQVKKEILKYLIENPKKKTSEIIISGYAEKTIINNLGELFKEGFLFKDIGNSTKSGNVWSILPKKKYDIEIILEKGYLPQNIDNNDENE